MKSQLFNFQMEVSEVVETQQGSLNSALKTEGGSNETTSYEYHIPDWFSNGNIKTPADLAEFRSCVYLSKEDYSKEPEVGDNKQYKIRYDRFEGLKDATLAAFVCNRYGQLPPELPTVQVRVYHTREVESLNGIVLHLARDISATLVSIELEDLEDLSYEFKRQDENHGRPPVSEEDPGPSIAGISDLHHYFAVRSERHASKSAWSQVNGAISAIVDAARVKARVCISTTVVDHETSPDPPIILHLRNVNRIASTDEKYRCLSRFRNFVQESRKAGEKLVLIATILHSEKPLNGDCGTKLVEKLGACDDLLMVVMPKLCAGAELSWKEIENKYHAMANTRRLKGILRRKLVNGDSIDFLHPSSDWGDFGNTCFLNMLRTSALWCRIELKQATIQIIGRSLRKPALDLNDIKIVLRRLSLCTASQESQSEEEVQDDKVPDVDDAENADKVQNVITWEKKMNRIKQSCNKYELKILAAVVNPEHLQSTYDDVIIDSGSKETMKYLVSMSNFCPEAKSTLLLNQIRINGALLYGPPGTGKTHLSRAVAKDSGMNMIAIDSAAVKSKWVGESEKLIKASFTLASKLFPCVLFIDEVDALFYRRGSDDRSWERSALTQFLQCLDGLVQDKKAPFVIAATNRPSDLDDAFLRRLPQKLLFKLPDEESRLKILRIFLKDEDLHPSLDVEGLARATEGYSGSDIRSLCGEAAMIWSIEQERGKVGDALKEKVKLCLEARHFAKAFQGIRPSVSEKVLEDFASFAKRYNASDFKDSSTASDIVDERLFTKPMATSDEATLVDASTNCSTAEA
ncbi:ATPase family AAA domain-containing protein 1-A [Annulohypoxylon moriforme]|nr:ATPase family AAA domain-containing protein 1-A [Annulohypoxylon moriforme]